MESVGKQGNLPKQPFVALNRALSVKNFGVFVQGLMKGKTDWFSGNVVNFERQNTVKT